MGSSSSYLGEFRFQWRPLLGAALGLAGGLGIHAYISGLFLPHLSEEFGWSKAMLAATGINTALAVLVLPIVGRLTDLWGARRIAAFGVAVLPSCYMGLSLLEGDVVYFWLFETLLFVGGLTTTATVYSSVVTFRFSRARGLALGIALSAPPLASALMVPWLSNYVDTEGWRAGYRLMAGYCLFSGLLALALLPRTSGIKGPTRKKFARADFEVIGRSGAFWTLIIGVMLCNLANPLGGAQMKPMLLDIGLDSGKAAALMSLYAVGVVAGRLLSGLSLDRFPAHIVASLWLGAPAIGLITIPLFGLSSPEILLAASILMALSQGAEGDISAYLAARYFQKRVFSTAVGAIVSAFSLSSAAGSVILAAFLSQTDSYVQFMYAMAVTTVIGSFLILRIGRYPPAGDEASEQAPSEASN